MYQYHDRMNQLGATQATAHAIEMTIGCIQLLEPKALSMTCSVSWYEPNDILKLIHVFHR